uniref:Uncharacterized protein n=1 Tax=Meloidogyne hapla TaxID=6305 RepID=A0A1I8BN89_MELHA
MNDFKIYFQFYFQFLLISTFNLIAQFELLNNQNPLFNSSLFMSASGSALANLLPTEKIIENDINKNIISSQDDKKDYRQFNLIKLETLVSSDLKVLKFMCLYCDVPLTFGKLKKN